MIKIKNLVKEYTNGSGVTRVLDGVDLTIHPGEVLAVVGPSGAGKSTLAHCVNLLERPTSGSVEVNSNDLTRLKSRELRVARRSIGTIFQSAGLQTRRTVAENVGLPLRYLGATDRAHRRRVAELLDRVGLSERADFYPHQLSGGQQQRVGIARALTLRPSVLLADEATSGLDPETTRSITTLLRELRDELDLAILFITHEMDTVVNVADTVARLDHGRIVEHGQIGDLLVDSQSAVGAALIAVDSRAARSFADAANDVWHIAYGAENVRSDWLAVLSAEVDPQIGLLQADVRIVNGYVVGYALVRAANHRREAFRDSVRRLGLNGTLLEGTDLRQRELEVVGQ
ncbi:methionine ABC transporter ATP-binding protein [Microbacterium sp. CH12i]|uniref:methionine ABC transporter ATP-binding protein n=1 Tax=Microbacterium sp. CH12i TaxID=1479651 RepID=UPI000460EDB6|nr:ATP-binding cassette domain-containing protein [Microbacterium sp. CH12i]KDA05520.1 methionine ABC transporter ATP-binding protein [Microbacterium sp. CH12i]